jgi:hypothetical protein
MLKYSPLIVLVVSSAAFAADKVPSFDIARECSFEGSVLGNQQQCIQDEKQARDQLQKEWSQFPANDKRQCQDTATMAGTASYVEFITCLEMARDVRNPQANGSQSQTTGKSRK